MGFSIRYLPLPGEVFSGKFSSFFTKIFLVLDRSHKTFPCLWFLHTGRNKQDSSTPWLQAWPHHWKLHRWEHGCIFNGHQTRCHSGNDCSCVGEDKVWRFRCKVEGTRSQISFLMPVHSWFNRNECHWLHHYQHISRNRRKVRLFLASTYTLKFQTHKTQICALLMLQQGQARTVRESHRLHNAWSM